MKSAKKKSRPGTAMKVKPANEIMADDFFRSPSEVKKKKRLDDPASAASTLSATLPQKKPKSVKKSKLVDAGAALIAVHARYRGSATRRRDGPAHLDQVRIIKQALGDNSAALLTNGNVRNGAELVEALEVTGADGVMCAEGILDDPALFARACLEGEARHRQLRKRLRKAKRLAALADERELTADEARKAAQLNPLRVALKKLPTLPAPPEVAPPTRPALAAEYLALLAQAPKECAVPVHTARFHARRICRDELEELGLLELMRDAESVAEVDRLVRLCEGRMPQNSLEREAVAEAAAAAAAEKAREKRNATRRKEFEDRMKRRARREGKADDEYIRQGLAPPDADAVAELRALQPKERMGWWSARFGQHCLAYHAEGECARSNGTFGCAFLHVKPAAPADEPSAMG